MADSIFCYKWSEIQDAQQGKSLSKPIVDMGKPVATDDDVKLLEKHGLTALEHMQFYGVIDRLKNSGLIYKGD